MDWRQPRELMAAGDEVYGELRSSVATLEISMVMAQKRTMESDTRRTADEAGGIKTSRHQSWAARIHS
jgi:hypothetical protein